MGANRHERRLHSRYLTALAAAAALVLAAALPAASGVSAGGGKSNGTWKHLTAKPAESKNGQPAKVKAEKLQAYEVDAAALERTLAAAPAATTSASLDGSVLTLPSPTGELQRFEIQESPVMERGLAAKHPEIATYSGRGLDDPTATVRADLTPLGFHASVRSPAGAYYVDPLYGANDSTYATYYLRDLEQREGEHAAKDPLDEAEAVAEAVAAEIPAGPAVTLRTYRLALLTDPSYTAYHGGPDKVTAAKVTLMNRVNQIYEDETAIRLVLIADNDKLNFDTNADAIEPNGPCGLAPCFTPAQLSSCTSSALQRNRIVIGQIIGASNYDIGHLALGNPGGGVASLNAVGGNAKAQGCTGLPTPIGDYFAVDYVAHEMGHQFGGNHTFNGTQHNCGGNKAAPSVEPGSGSSIMAYAGICRHDNLQPHSDPYWSQWSFQEITAFVTSNRNPISEVQNASLRDYTTDGDAFTLSYGGRTTNPFVRGTSYTIPHLLGALQGSEVQTVSLVGFDADGDSFRLGLGAAESVPLVRGQNYTPAGVLAAIQGGNEQQQVTLTDFDPATESFRIQVGALTTAPIGFGGATVNNAGIAAAVNALGAASVGTVSSSGAGAGGFTLTFAGSKAATDMPTIAIVDCACTSAVRENVKGSPRLAGFSTQSSVTLGALSDAGFAFALTGNLVGVDAAPFSVASATGATGEVVEALKGGNGILPAGALVTVAGFGGQTALDDAGFQVTFGGTLANTNLESLGIGGFAGASGWIGETAKGGAVDNRGHVVTVNGNHAPVVSVPMSFTIPIRTPFALEGSATDSDGDTLTYMWEQADRGGGTGTALTDNNKVNGPLFRQFGTAALVTEEETLKTPSAGLNIAGTDPQRVFPDLRQILANNTNAVAGTCPAFAGLWPTPVPLGDVDCYSEFLPTAAYLGVAGVNAAPAALNFRLTVRDNRPGGAGIGTADTKLVLAPAAGPFLVTSQAAADSLPAGSAMSVTWDVAGTNLPPVGTENVKISLSDDGGLTYPHVLAPSTPNDGAASVEVPNVDTAKARVKVEAVGNVYFDLSAIDFTTRSARTLLTELGAYVAGIGPGSSIAAKVRAASSALAAGDEAGACTATQDLLSQVRAQTGRTLTAAQAEELNRRLGWIRNALDC